MVSEKQIERTMVCEVKKLGGLALKFLSPSMDGVPDRIVLFHGGKLAFVELKAPSKKLRPLQIRRKKQLEALGFKVYCIDNLEMIGGVLNEIQSS